jgi:flagellar L-ring protein precursor FlgH
MKLNLLIGIFAGSAIAVTGALAQQAGEQGPLSVPGSLFSQATSSGLLEKRTALHKGDIVTIIVSESTSGSASAQTSSSKADQTSYSTSLPAVTAVTSQFLTGLLKNVANGALVGGNTAATSATAGAGSTATNSAFSTQITCIVTDAKPNGTLTIEGKRSYKMNKQTQTLLVQGVVRVDDISMLNTVLSNNVADLRLVADGKGLIADRASREGLLTKLLSWLF